MITRLLQTQDAERMAHYYQSNRAHFKAWEPTRPSGFHSPKAWDVRIQELTHQQVQKSAAYFVTLQPENGNIIAHCTLSQISYGAFQACYMGYGISACMEGKGVMHNTCTAAIRYAFDELKLNRIMANYMPHNNRSAKLLHRLGFQKEGLAKNYLQISGRWEHHVLTSLTRSASSIKSEGLA